MELILTYPSDMRTDRRVVTARTDAAWTVWHQSPAGETRDRLRDAIWQFQDRADAGHNVSSIVGALDAAELNAHAEMLGEVDDVVTESQSGDAA